MCDNLLFAHKTLTGDGSITAKIEGMTPPHYTTHAGLMIRRTLDSTSPHASVAVTSLGEVVFQYRTRELEATRSRYVSNKVTLPCWVKLTRIGNRFSVQHSSDGVDWQPVGTEPSDVHASLEIPMETTVHIGLVLQPGHPARKTQAQMSQVRVTGAISSADPFRRSTDITISGLVQKQIQ